MRELAPLDLFAPVMCLTRGRTWWWRLGVGRQVRLGRTGRQITSVPAGFGRTGARGEAGPGRPVPAETRLAWIAAVLSACVRAICWEPNRCSPARSAPLPLHRSLELRADRAAAAPPRRRHRRGCGPGHPLQHPASPRGSGTSASARRSREGRVGRLILEGRAGVDAAPGGTWRQYYSKLYSHALCASVPPDHAVLLHGVQDLRSELVEERWHLGEDRGLADFRREVPSALARTDRGGRLPW